RRSGLYWSPAWRRAPNCCLRLRRSRRLYVEGDQLRAAAADPVVPPPSDIRSQRFDHPRNRPRSGHGGKPPPMERTPAPIAHSGIRSPALVALAETAVDAMEVRGCETQETQDGIQVRRSPAPTKRVR